MNTAELFSGGLTLAPGAYPEGASNGLPVNAGECEEAVVILMVAEATSEETTINVKMQQAGPAVRTGDSYELPTFEDVPDGAFPEITGEDLQNENANGVMVRRARIRLAPGVGPNVRAHVAIALGGDDGDIPMTCLVIFGNGREPSSQALVFDV